MLLFVKNLLFTVFVPGTVAVFIPYRIASRVGPGLVFEPSRVVWSAPLFWRRSAPQRVVAAYDRKR
jgi:hypothetical protein